MSKVAIFTFVTVVCRKHLEEQATDQTSTMHNIHRILISHTLSPFLTEIKILIIQMSLICAIFMINAQTSPCTDGEVKCSDDGVPWGLPIETAKCASTWSDCINGIAVHMQSNKQLVCNDGFYKYG